jgi:DNA-binding XRE family transcriptional regulator
MTPAELKELRIAHGLSQRMMGELLGYHGNTIARIERGDKDTPITKRFEKLVRSIFSQRKVKKVSPTT